MLAMVCFVTSPGVINHREVTSGLCTLRVQGSRLLQTSRQWLAGAKPQRGHNLNVIIKGGENLSNNIVAIPKMTSSDSEGPGLGLRIISGVLILAFLVSSFGPLSSVLQGRGGVEQFLNGQLRKVPVFTVTDSNGRPYLTETEDHKLKKGYFFVQPRDADAYLAKVQNESQDAKVLALGLNEAVKFLDKKGTPAKSVPEIFELFPDGHEVDIAQQLTNGQFKKLFGSNGVPIFFIDGLAFKDPDSEATVYPLFFEKERLEEALTNLKKNAPSSTIDMSDVQIIDFYRTVEEIRTGANPRLERVAFIPLQTSVEKLEKLNAAP